MTLDYKSVCDKCYRKNYSDTAKQCGYQPCPGTLRVIDYGDLPERFKYAYKTGERIRVKFPWGEVKTGTVGLTTGWKPAFLLIARRNSHGSSDILSHDVVFTTEKITRR